MKTVPGEIHKHTASHVILTIAATMVVIAGLRAARNLLIPIALAATIAIIVSPLLLWLKSKRVPFIFGIPLVILMTFVLLFGVLGIATTSFSQMAAEAPSYVANFMELEVGLIAWLASYGLEIPPGLLTDAFNAERTVEIVGDFLRGLASFASNSVIVFIITVFILAEASTYPKKLRMASGSPDADLSRYVKILGEVQHYMVLKTFISAVTGILIWVWTTLFGLDFALFWGLLAFAFNFIPSIGSIIASIPAVLVALLQLGVPEAFVIATGYLVVNTLLGNIIEPHIMGRGLGVSTLTVILSLLFWGWIWGPIGMLLSIPLTMILKVAFENSAELQWLAILMSPAEGVETKGRWSIPTLHRPPKG